jgi:hypothetical protein
VAGLLDNYGVDPLGQGLLNAGIALMTPRAYGGGVAGAFQGFNSGLLQAQQMRRALEQDARRNKLTDAQLARYEAEAQQAKADADERTAQRQRIAQWVETLPPELRQAALIKPEAVLPHILPQKSEAYTLPPGARRYGADGKVIAENPKEAPTATPTELEKLIAARNSLPPGHPDRSVIDGRIAALNYRQPPASMNVSYGAPFTGVGPDGQPQLFQPSNRGGPPQPLGLRPPPTPAPAATVAQVQGIDAEMRTINSAIEDVKRTPSAFSLERGVATMAGSIPESVRGRMDSPEERKVRAFVYNVVSKSINERAGAAQSAQELARLRSFLPAETDNAQQVQDKLVGYQQYLSERRKGFEVPGIPAAPTGGGTPAPAGGFDFREAARKELERRQREGK